MLDNAFYSIVPALTLSVGMVLWLAERYRRRADSRREIDRLPRVAIRDAPEHRRVKIVGKVRILDKPLVAPLSGRPCSFYDAFVTEQALGEDSRRSVIVREVGGQDFLVEDDSGRALVRVDRAQIFVKFDAQYQSQGSEATSRQAALLRRHDREANGRLGYSEGTLTPGETVAVLGTAVREPDPNPQAGTPFRDQPMRLVFAGNERELLYVTDDLTVKPRS